MPGKADGEEPYTGSRHSPLSSVAFADRKTRLVAMRRSRKPKPAPPPEQSERGEPTSAAGPEFTVLNIGSGYPLRQTLPGLFQSPEWRELRHDLNRGSNPDIVSPI